MTLSNMSIFSQALEMSTRTVIQPQYIMVIQGEEYAVIQGEEQDMDALENPQNFRPLPGALEPQEEREEHGAHYVTDMLLKCVMGDSGCLRVFQEFERYLLCGNSFSDCDAPEDYSSDEETTDDDNDDDDDGAIAEGQPNLVNVREEENHDEGFQLLLPVLLEDEELTSDKGVNKEAPLPDSKQELQKPQSHTSTAQTHAKLYQLINYPCMKSSTSTVKGGAASTFNRATEEPENNTSEDAVNDTSGW